MIWLDVLVLIVYFASMIAIGLWAMRHVKAQEDYFMGGRSFGKLLQTFAAFGAGTGAHEPVTVGRTIWTSGLSGVWSALMWLFVTPIYWITAVWYRRMRHLTLGDWFVERYESKAMGAAYTLFAIVFYVFYLSTMFSAIAKFTAPLLGFDTIWGMDLKFVLVPTLATVVVAYGVLGGLTAAYWTDLVQGIFIIVLSVLLIPSGLSLLVERYGDPTTQGWTDGFAILHQHVSSDYFGLFDGPAAGEFPLQYIVSLTLLVLVGIVVQPHFIATGGGSAKSEDEARIGLVVGNFLKRLCTVGWAITGLIALALLAGNIEVIEDPDRVWGVAAREILGPMQLGLVGLMLACLMAAMMSSADTYMLVTSGLVVRNVYAPYFDPNASEAKYVRVARVAGLIVIVGASIVAMTFADVFAQFKMAVEIPILSFAAPFWVGLYWRKANTRAVWGTMGIVLFLFLVLPYAIPVLAPGLRTDASYTLTTHQVTTTTTRAATVADVARQEAWEKAVATATESGDTARLKRLGAAPPKAAVGEMIQLTVRTGGQSIFWSDGVKPVGESRYEPVGEIVTHGARRIETMRPVGPQQGYGTFNIDFLVYHWMGMDLGGTSKATLETLRLPPRLLTPFAILILLSFFTRRNTTEGLDRYFAKMKTEVDPDPVRDQAALAAAYADPASWKAKRLCPVAIWNFRAPDSKTFWVW